VLLPIVRLNDKYKINFVGWQDYPGLPKNSALATAQPPRKQKI
jgi:hypothetical protein